MLLLQQEFELEGVRVSVTLSNGKGDGHVVCAVRVQRLDRRARSVIIQDALPADKWLTYTRMTFVHALDAFADGRAKQYSRVYSANSKAVVSAIDSLHRARKLGSR